MYRGYTVYPPVVYESYSLLDRWGLNAMARRMCRAYLYSLYCFNYTR